jgi:Polyketide cyclase / dehydrase and lipid transport
VDLSATLDAPCPPNELFEWVDDLGRYPSWHTIVTRAEPDGDGAWLVDLRGHLGPLARSKRLRMKRVALEPEHLAVFRRAERDGRDHADWSLRATVEPAANGSRLVMDLHYGGALWGPVLERLLREEIEASRRRLLALVSGRTP